MKTHVVRTNKLIQGIEYGFISRRDEDDFYIKNTVDETGVYYLKQTHSNKVFHLKQKVNYTQNGKIVADAIITNIKNIPIAVSSADCVPILIYEKNNPFVAAIHAGWRGALSNIIENTFIKLLSLADDNQFNFNIIIGPAIDFVDYQVHTGDINKNSDCIINNFLSTDPSYIKFFYKFTRERFFNNIDKQSIFEYSYHFDIKAFCIAKIKKFLDYDIYSQEIKKRYKKQPLLNNFVATKVDYEIINCDINTFRDKNFPSYRRSQFEGTSKAEIQTFFSYIRLQ
jgi:YfiH family protein